MKEQIKEKELKTYNVLNNRMAKVALAASLLLTGVTSTISTVGPSNGIVGELLKIEHAEAASVFDGGTGTVANPYLVSNKAQLNEIRNYTSSHFKLTNDIDLSGVAWVPVGKSSSASFKGSFDGDDFEISGLNVVFNASYSGLFGYVTGDLKNVHLSNVSIEGKDYVGGLVGYTTGNIKNVSVTGVVNGVSSTGYAGGVAGYFYGSSKVLEEASSGVTVSSTGPYIGGIAGTVPAGTVRNSYSTGRAFSNSTSTARLGGIVGYAGPGVLISDVFSAGIVDGGKADVVGGIVGQMYDSSTVLKNGYSIASVSGDQSVGGLVGQGNSASYSNLYTLNQDIASTDAKSAKTFGQLDKGKATVTDIYMPETALGFGKHGYVTNLLTNSALNKGVAYDSLLSTGLWAIDPISKLPYLTFNKAVLQPLMLESKVNYVEKDGFIYATIDSRENLQKLNLSMGAGSFLLLNDIDLSGIEWDSVGIQSNAFEGSLEGNGHTINGLNTSKALSYQGLFGNISGDISNLRLTNANINKAKGYTGILAGESTGNLKNIYVQGNIDASGNYVGGVVGKHEKGIISNLFADVNVTNPSTYTGGITAYTTGVIENSASIGDIAGSNNAAGITGNLGPGGIIRNVYSAGNISGVYRVAGIAGMSSGSITNAYSIANIVGEQDSGGIVGDLRGPVDSVYGLSASVSNKKNVANKSLGTVIGVKENSASVINAVSLDSISGVANNNYITSTINKSEAMRKDSYPWFNSNNTSWAIDDGKSLPYLQLEVNGQYYNPTTGGWMDKPIKDNSEQIKIATSSVEKAEKSELQADVLEARTLVNALPSIPEKNSLIARLDIVQKNIIEKEALITQTEAARASVIKAEGSKLQVDITSGYGLVNLLPVSTEKTNLINRLNVIQKAIDDAKTLANQITIATTSVVKAEGSKLQADVAAARTLVNEIPTSTEKTNLTNRLNKVQESIDLVGKIITATASVVKAEGSKTQVDVDAAKVLVNALPTGTEKTNLTTRLTVVQKAIDDATALANQIAIATTSVSKAEGSKLQADVNSAKTLVNALPTGTEKTNLTTRLTVVQKAIDDATALANQIATATTSVSKAETTKLQVDVNSAKTLVNALPNGTEKTNLTTRLNTVQKAIDDAIALANQIAVATTSVTKAEGSKTQVDVDSAKVLVNALPNGTEKTNLTTRLNTVQKAIDNAIALANQIAVATTSVTKAEGSKTQVDVDSAKVLVNALPNGTEKTNLTTRLNTVQKGIDDAIALANQIATATTSVSKAEGSKLQVDVNSAKILVNALPNGTEKTNLTTRLNTVQKAIDDAIALANQIAVATTSVTKAEGAKTQVNVDAARTLVTALPNGTEKTNLTTRLNTVQKAIDDAIALANQITVATTSVAKAEGSKTQVDVDSAKVLVNALPNGTEKTNLTTRLNTVQKGIDDAIALANQIAVATTSVSKAEGSKLQVDVNSAKTLVNALPTGTEKTNLTTRLTVVQKAIDDAIALANQIAVATTSVSKAEGSKLQVDVDAARTLVTALPNGTEKTNLTTRLATVQKAIDDAIALANQIAVATTSVSKAEGSKTQVDVDAAKVLVTALPTGTEKTSLTTRLNTVQKAIDDAIALANQIATATTSVSKAEGSKTQVDVDSARTLVTALPTGTEKTNLTTRLNTVQKAIDDAIALANQIAVATTSVSKAEGSKLQVDVDSARTLVMALPNGTEKTNLTTRLATVQKAIDDAISLVNQIAVATTSVSKAEGSKLQVDVNSAKTLVNALPTGTEKTNLTTRLTVVQKAIDDAIALANQIAVATTSVSKAEGTMLQADTDSARTLVMALPNGTEKTDLTTRLNVLQKSIDDAIALANQIIIATNSVVKAEGSNLQLDVDLAVALVTGLPNSSKKISLTNRLNAVQKNIDDALALDLAKEIVSELGENPTQEEIDDAKDKIKELSDGPAKELLLDLIDKAQEKFDADKAEVEENLKQVELATKAVEKSETSETQGNVDAARNLVNDLKNKDVKTELTNRLDVVQENIYNAKALELVYSLVNKLGGNPTQEQIDKVRSEVESLSNSEDKTKLREVVDAKQKALDNKIIDAEKMVQAISSPPSQDEIDKAQSKVNLLPVGKVKEELQEAIEKQKLIFEENNQNLLLKATDAVAKAEEFPTNYNISIATNLVASLSANGDKTSLLNRLQEIQDKLALEKAEMKVKEAENYERDPYLKEAITAVEALKNSKDKQELQERLQVVLDKLDAEKEGEVIPLVPSEPNSPNWDVTTAIAEVVDAEAKLYFTNWNKAVTNAVKYPSNSTIKNVKAYLENLPTPYKLYVSYYYIIDYLKEHTNNIGSSNEESNLEVYVPIEQAVSEYEKYKTNYYLNKAKELVKALTDSKEKESFEKRLGLHEMPIKEPENAEKLAQIQAAGKAVENYEKYKSSYYQKKAIQAVELLLDSEEKTAFQNRLNAVRS